MPAPEALIIQIKGERKEDFRTVAVEDGLTFGRSKDNKCAIKDDHISRYHAKIVLEKNRWVLKETAAKNPVVVKLRGEEFKLRERGSCCLEPGLEFTIGPRRCYVFEAAAPPAAPAPPPAPLPLPPAAPPARQPAANATVRGKRAPEEPLPAAPEPKAGPAAAAGDPERTVRGSIRPLPRTVTAARGAKAAPATGESDTTEPASGRLRRAQAARKPARQAPAGGKAAAREAAASPPVDPEVTQKAPPPRGKRGGRR